MSCRRSYSIFFGSFDFSIVVVITVLLVSVLLVGVRQSFVNSKAS